MKIFVSYSRTDADDFAEQIQNHFAKFKEFDVFIDVSKLIVGDPWSHKIEENISDCDIFIVIVTYGSLNSSYVGSEVLQAQRENKKIVPCFHKNVRNRDIKWGLKEIQGVKFDNSSELVRNLYSEISNITGQDPDHQFMGDDGYAYPTTQPRNQGVNLKIIIPAVTAAIAIVGVILAITFGGIDITPNPNPSPSPSTIDNNNPPVPLDDPSITTSINQPVNIQLLIRDKDPNTVLTAAIVSGPTHGYLSDINQATGITTYTPNTGYVGTDSFTFKANDGKVDSNNVGKVSIAINP